MSMRRRQNGVVPSEDFKSVKLGADDKKKSQRLRWRKRTFLGIPVLVIIVL
jgi:hypothetical protein